MAVCIAVIAKEVRGQAGPRGQPAGGEGDSAVWPECGSEV